MSATITAAAKSTTRKSAKVTTPEVFAPTAESHYDMFNALTGECVRVEIRVFHLRDSEDPADYRHVGEADAWQSMVVDQTIVQQRVAFYPTENVSPRIDLDPSLNLN